MTGLPKKLKKDAIAEAVVEVRFDTDEAPEIVLGRLTDDPEWKAFRRTRSAISELPSAIRLSDPNLRFQAHFDLREVGGHRHVKIGTNVVSFHIHDVYCGWEKFKPQVDHLVDVLFEKISNVAVRRIGLRYLNSLTLEDHKIRGVQDLSFKAEISGVQLTDSINLNYGIVGDDSRRTMVRIASPDFVEGPHPEKMTAFIDVDVFTIDGYRESNRELVKKWIEDAHDSEKRAFFALLPKEIINDLKEE